jgi:formate dehydrogenase subunit delta
MNQHEELHADPTEKLIRMAREIADNYKSYPEPEASASVANHINRCWTPKMREQVLAAMQEGGRALPPLLLAAGAKIKRRKAN